MTTDKALMKIDVAKKALIEARSMEEVVEIRDRAMAAEVYARAKGYEEAANIAKEAQLRAERRAGEFLKDAELNKGGRPEENLSHDVTGFDEKPKLDDLGISRMQSSRWQKIASIPEDQFEQHIAETKMEGKELTQAAILRLTKPTKLPSQEKRLSFVIPEHLLNRLNEHIKEDKCSISDMICQALEYYFNEFPLSDF